MNNPYEAIDDLSDAILDELDGTNLNWLAEVIAEFLQNDDAIEFRRQVRRHLDDVLLPNPAAEDEA